MSDLHRLSQSYENVRGELSEFVTRCDLIMEHVFHRPYDDRQQFRRWIEEFAISDEDVVLLLHENPLYITAEYLNIDPHAVHTGAMLRDYTALSRRQHWN